MGSTLTTIGLPVALGLSLTGAFADRMDKPVRVASVVILAIVIGGAIASNLELLLENAGRHRKR